MGLQFVSALFPTARVVIRIASAYFSLKGYRLARAHIGRDVQIHVLVGREEGPELRKAVLEEISTDLARPELDNWQNVKDLVERIKTGKFFIRDARQSETRFHCKFYICDDQALWHGSANYTGSGLSDNGNAEQASVSRDEGEVAAFSLWYDDVAREATDLLGPLLARLEDWLALRSPFDVYLSALYHLLHLAAVDIGRGGHEPLYFQKAIVVRALRQIEEYAGALAVVATGLGKTVIGADVAHRLKERGEINRVILIAPRSVQGEWRTQLDARNIKWDGFTPETLFRKTGDARHHRARILEEHFKLADAHTLIVVDEAHFARNQLVTEIAREEPSLLLRRLKDPKLAGSKFLLLTATPYGTNPQNLASILALLPETMPGGLGVPLRWQADSIRAFIGLQIVSNLGFPHLLDIARARGDVDEEQRPFVTVKGQRRYLPKTLRLRTETFRPMLETEMEQAFDERYFSQAKLVRHVWVDDDGAVRKGMTDPVMSSTMAAWLSSPAALGEVLERNLYTEGEEQIDLEDLVDSPEAQGAQLGLSLIWEVPSRDYKPLPTEQGRRGYRTHMALPRAKREDRLRSILDRLRDGSVGDEKVQRLTAIVMRHCVKARQKAIVFTRKPVTAVQVHRALAETFRGRIHIECTACERAGRARLRTPDQREAARRLFAPASHDEPAPAKAVAVLVSTDADAVGVNLQDADVVINYDLPDSSDVLFQRAGRVLRMTPNPDRDIWFYTFVPTWHTRSLSTSEARKRVERILERLMHRHTTASGIIGGQVVSAKGEEDATLERDDVDVEAFLRAQEAFEGWHDSPAADAANHIALLEQHNERARSLPLAIHSARYYHGVERWAFALIRMHERVLPIVYNVDKGVLELGSERAALNLIACMEEEPLAAIPAHVVESETNNGIRLYCAERGLDVTAAITICAMLLVPQAQRRELAHVLD